ncbi:MAG: ABC transporter ATP-binding protein [Sphingobacteriales bacterium]|nr:MAG: ABC transporter ATP-binding protein [Sphingobacteriales bacterium]
MALLSVTHLSGIEEGKTTVKNISFTQHKFEKIAIAGETGAGKTSLLKMIGGFMQPASGSILLNDERVKGPDEQLIAGHKKIAYLSQHFELRNNYRVHELLEMANKIDGERANKIYAICRIDHLLKRWTDELSGGEKQRISLARLLSTSPELLLLDEPFSNLDMQHKQQMKQVIDDLAQEMNITCMLVSHDALDILSWADTVFFMRNGQIIQRGTAAELYNRPTDEYCAALLGTYNLIDTSLIPFLKQGDKKFFCRPGEIKIANPDTAAIKGIVKKILYWGSYYTIDVLVQGQLFFLQTPTHTLHTGDETGLEFASANRWYL